MVTIYSVGGKVRRNEYPLTLAAKVDAKTRATVEKLAMERCVSMGAITREILSNGLKVMGLEA